MQTPDENGSAKSVLAIVILVISLIASGIFGGWAYKERQNTKNNLDKIVKEEVGKAELAQAAKLKAEFDEKEKKPTKTYQGPSTYGTISFAYPKTWSAYIDESNSSTPINGYFHPNQVPGISGGNTVYALRLELLSTPYASALQQYDSQIRAGRLKAVAYVPPQMAGVANVQPGVRLDGEINNDQTGSMVIIKIRDKTLKLSTLSTDYRADFNNIVLANLKFTP